MIRPLSCAVRRWLLVVVSLLGAVCLIWPVSPARAAAGVNSTLAYQGRLLSSTGAVVPDGNYNMRFRLYQDGTGTTAGNSGTGLKWTEEYRNSLSQGVIVKNGFFTVTLGTHCAFDGSACSGGQTQSNSTVDWNQSVLWLSIDVGGTSTGAITYDGEMLPMRRLASAVYALQADNTSQLGTFTSSDLLQNVAPNLSQQTANLNILNGAASSVAAAEIQTVASATAPVLILKNGATPGSGGDLLQWRLSTNTLLGHFDSSGNLFVANTFDRRIAGTIALGGTATSIALNKDTTVASGAGLTVQSGTTSFTGPSGGSSTALLVTAGANSNLPLAVQAGATPSTNLFEIQQSTGIPLTYFDSSANLVMRYGMLIQVGTNPLTAAGEDLSLEAGAAGGGTNNGGIVHVNGGTPTGGGNIGYVLLGSSSGRVGVGASQPSAKLHVVSASSSTVGIILQAASSQTADATQVQDVNGNIFASFNANGNQLTLGTVAGSMLSGASSLAGSLRFGDGTTTNRALTLTQDTLSASYITNLAGSLGSAGQCQGISSASGSTEHLGYVGCASTTLSNLTGPTAISTDLTFAAADRQLTIATQGAAGAAGNALSVVSATGNGAGAGGELDLNGGTGGTSGAGGNVGITGGAGTGSASNGGDVTVSAGAKAGSSAGSVIVAPQASNDSASAFVVQNAAGTPLLTVDTSAANIVLGTAGSTSATLQLANATNANLVGLRASSGSAALTYQLPATTPGSSLCSQAGTVSGSTIPLTFGTCGSSGASDTLSNLTGPTSINTALTFAAADRQLTIATQGTAATAGNILTLLAATGNTTGSGGPLALVGGTGGATGVGGNLNLYGGSGGGGNTNGGNLTISAGTRAGSGAFGSTIIKPQASNNSASAFSVQNAAGTSLITADTSTPRLYIGTVGGDTTGALTVVGVKTNAGDPTEVDGAMYYNSSSKGFRCGINGGWRSCNTELSFSNLATSTLSNVTVITNFTTDTNSNSIGYDMLANDCQPGVVYVIRAAGTYSANAAAGGGFRLYLNADNTSNTLDLQAGTNGPATQPVDYGWAAKLEMICQTSGTSGTVEVQGLSFWNSANSSTSSSLLWPSTGAVTFNTTITHTLYMGVKFPNGTNGDTMTLRQFIVERLGP